MDNISPESITYLEQGFVRERYPYSWMWYSFMKEDSDPRNQIFGGIESEQACYTWEEMEFQGPRQVTWEQATGPAFEVRSKPVSWKWGRVTCDLNSEKAFTQSIPWNFTKQEGILKKTWRQIKEYNCPTNDCFEPIPALSAHPVVRTYTKKIRVLENPPAAYLTVVGTVSGTSPVQVRLTPRFTRSGSFPIEKIIWDLGDGTPIFEQKRWSSNKDPRFVYTKVIERDAFDPRNFDVVHTYTRTSNDSSCFYPSITAVASSTSTIDRAATVVGPLNLTPLSDFNILQNELTNTGKAYVGQINNQVVFLSHKDPQP